MPGVSRRTLLIRSSSRSQWSAPGECIGQTDGCRNEPLEDRPRARCVTSRADPSGGGRERRQRLLDDLLLDVEGVLVGLPGAIARHLRALDVALAFERFRPALLDEAPHL